MASQNLRWSNGPPDSLVMRGPDVLCHQSEKASLEQGSTMRSARGHHVRQGRTPHQRLLAGHRGRSCADDPRDPEPRQTAAPRGGCGPWATRSRGPSRGRTHLGFVSRAIIERMFIRKSPVQRKRRAWCLVSPDSGHMSRDILDTYQGGVFGMSFAMSSQWSSRVAACGRWPRNMGCQRAGSRSS